MTVGCIAMGYCRSSMEAMTGTTSVWDSLDIGLVLLLSIAVVQAGFPREIGLLLPLALLMGLMGLGVVGDVIGLGVALLLLLLFWVWLGGGVGLGGVGGVMVLGVALLLLLLFVMGVGLLDMVVGLLLF